MSVTGETSQPCAAVPASLCRPMRPGANGKCAALYPDLYRIANRPLANTCSFLRHAKLRNPVQWWYTYTVNLAVYFTTIRQVRLGCNRLSVGRLSLLRVAARTDPDSDCAG